MNDNQYPMHVGIVVTSASQLASVYALLGGVALAGLVAGDRLPPRVEKPAGVETAQPVAEQPAGAAAPEPDAAEIDAAEIDAHGHPWSAALHAATRGKTKDGLWRMKVGVSRPAALPGFPVEAPTGTSGNGQGAQATGSATTAGAASPAATIDEDDEFAAFRQAAAKTDAAGAAAAAAVPARKWTDADLGALCNQAAVKLGDPSPVKEIIATFIPEGTVAHSRNIPEDKREAFAKAVEAKAGIEFAG